VITKSRSAPRSTTRVVIDRQLNPFEAMTPDERKLLIVRVLCGLVAYDSDPAVAPSERLAG